MPKLPDYDHLKINQAAKFLGVSTKTLRRWEDRGILTPKRTPGNQRVYDLNDLVEFRRHQKKIKHQARKITYHINAAKNESNTLKRIDANLQKHLKGFEVQPVQRIILKSFLGGLVVLSSLTALDRSGILKVSEIKNKDGQVAGFLTKVREKYGTSVSLATGGLMFNQKVDQNIAYSQLKDPNVLAAVDIEDAIFGINIPAFFGQDVEVEGNLTAPNILYSIIAGNNVAITGDAQNPTISVDIEDATEDLNIFSNITTGGDTVNATSNNDTLTFESGTGINISANASERKISISASSSDLNISGWIKDGSTIRLVNPADTVQVGSLLDLSSITHTTTVPQGLKLPQGATLANVSVGEGFLAYDTTSKLVKVFNGTSWANISGASTTLQQSYDNDDDGGNAVIQLTQADGSVIVRNPATSGSTTGYAFGIEQLNTGNIAALNITQSGTGPGINLNNATIVNIGNAGTDFDSSGGLTLAGSLTVSGLSSGAIYSSGGVVTSEAQLAVTRGGTGLGSYTTGDILYASGATTLSALGIGSDGQVLTVSSGVPVWQNPGGGTGDGAIGWLQRNLGVLSPTNITDDFAIGGIATSSAKFQVFGNTGNILTTGTLTLPNSNTLTGVTNYTQFSQGISVGGASTYYINASGVANLNSLTLAGNLAMNGGDLTTNQTTFNLLNSTATTINFAGAATSLNIGAASGTTTINNNLNVNGDLQIGGGDLTATTASFNLLQSGVTTLNIGGAATTLSLGAATGTATINNATTVIAGNLDVNGTSNDIAGTLNLSGGALTSTGTLNLTPQTGNNLNVALSGAGNLAVNTNQLFVQTSNGNVGIGTDSPTSKLHVSGAVTGKALVTLNETGDQNILVASASGTTVFVLGRDGLIKTASVNSASIVDGSVANADLANSSVTINTGSLNWGPTPATTAL